MKKGSINKFTPTIIYTPNNRYTYVMRANFVGLLCYNTKHN